MVILSRLLPILEESVLEDFAGNLSVASPYGVRNEKRNKHSNLIDYVSLGYDPDLTKFIKCCSEIMIRLLSDILPRILCSPAS